MKARGVDRMTGLNADVIGGFSIGTFLHSLWLQQASKFAEPHQSEDAGGMNVHPARYRIEYR